jgi:hypothetical protein
MSRRDFRPVLRHSEQFIPFQVVLSPRLIEL